MNGITIVGSLIFLGSLAWFAHAENKFGVSCALWLAPIFTIIGLWIVVIGVVVQ